MSCASTFMLRQQPSFCSLTLARWVGGASASGANALSSAVSCFSDANFKRIVAYVLVGIVFSNV